MMGAAAEWVDKSTTVRLRPVPVPTWLKAGYQVTRAVSSAGAARLARKLFFTPPRTLPTEGERAVLERGERFTLEVDGQRVIGWGWGEGPTVLLLHGWGGNTGQMTPLVEPLVAAGFRPVGVDMPAHGESEGQLSSLVHFDAALAHTAALFGPPRGLVAHSFGAAASTFSLSRELEVQRVVYFAPPARFDSFWSRFREGLGVSDEIWGRMMEESEAWLSVRFAQIAPVDLAPKMTAPLLVLHDETDREVAFAEGEQLARAWPGARLVPTRGLGHRRILRDPSSVDAAVRFLTS
jgi:pimeloyl-ACP methyl ester carboxylesterase